MEGITLETPYTTFFTWCCLPYVHFWELYLTWVYCLCVFVVLGVFDIFLCVFVVLLMCICCTSYVYLIYSYVYLLYFLCVFVVLLMCICCTLCVFVVPYVCLLYFMCICCTSYVYLLYLMSICCTVCVLLFLL